MPAPSWLKEMRRRKPYSHSVPARPSCTRCRSPRSLVTDSRTTYLLLKAPFLRKSTTSAPTASLYMMVVCVSSTVTKSVMATVFASSTATVPSCGPAAPVMCVKRISSGLTTRSTLHTFAREAAPLSRSHGCVVEQQPCSQRKQTPRPPLQIIGAAGLANHWRRSVWHAPSRPSPWSILKVQVSQEVGLTADRERVPAMTPHGCGGRGQASLSGTSAPSCTPA